MPPCNEVAWVTTLSGSSAACDEFHIDVPSRRIPDGRLNVDVLAVCTVKGTAAAESCAEGVDSDEKTVAAEGRAEEVVAADVAVAGVGTEAPTEGWAVLFGTRDTLTRGEGGVRSTLSLGGGNPNVTAYMYRMLVSSCKNKRGYLRRCR